ncbi:MAG: phosphotransferase enzyme family protein [Bacteroidota bacterium]
MKAAPYSEALAASTNYSGDDVAIVPLAGGLINLTYKVTIRPNGYRYILQQINKKIFLEPQKLAENYRLIWGFWSNEHPQWIPFPVTVPKPLRFTDGKDLFWDKQGECWRLMEFMANTTCLLHPANPEQAKKVAKTFACLTAGMEYYPIEQFHTTIPRFHDLSLRYWQFKESLHARNFDRLHKAARLIGELKKRERYVSFYEVISESDEFEKRLMHHDAKISNILFDDEETDKIICPVDFDTCMPGYFFSDLGDMIRSMAFSDDEDGVDADEIYIRKDYYEAVVEGYLEVMNEYLTEGEKKYTHSSGLLMIYMQALRFATDYLNGDIYYKTTYEEQNFDRAKNQLALLIQLENLLLEQYQFSI